MANGAADAKELDAEVADCGTCSLKPVLITRMLVAAQRQDTVFETVSSHLPIGCPYSPMGTLALSSKAIGDM